MHLTVRAQKRLRTHRTLIEHAPQLLTVLKEAVSTVARVTNEALKAVGTESAKLDFFGDSRIHPLAEAYSSQAPLRYGNYIAKLAVVPVSAAQQELAAANVEVDVGKDPNALRTATVSYLREHDAEFEVRIQLCTDLKKMPIEGMPPRSGARKKARTCPWRAFGCPSRKPTAKPASST